MFPRFLVGRSANGSEQKRYGYQRVVLIQTQKTLLIRDVQMTLFLHVKARSQHSETRQKAQEAVQMKEELEQKRIILSFRNDRNNVS